MWSILVSSEKGGALVPSHLHDRSVAQHLLKCCSKPKPSSIAETCLILINLVFTWCHMQMSPLCCGWTSLRNYGTHHFRFLLLWSPGSALTIDGTELIVRRTGEYMHGIQFSMFSKPTLEAFSICQNEDLADVGTTVPVFVLPEHQGVWLQSFLQWQRLISASLSAQSILIWLSPWIRLW